MWETFWQAVRERWQAYRIASHRISRASLATFLLPIAPPENVATPEAMKEDWAAVCREVEMSG